MGARVAHGLATLSILCGTVLLAMTSHIAVALSDKELVRKFAPVLEFYADPDYLAFKTFYQDQPDLTPAQKQGYQLPYVAAAQGYPMSAQQYYDAGCTTKECKYWVDEPMFVTLDTKAPVYYAVTKCGSQIRIKYHFFYPYQPPCQPLSLYTKTTFGLGAHQADWETVTVILTTDQTKVAAVLFGQHGGHYLRIAGRNGFQTIDGRPRVYVGQSAHGNFHDVSGQSVKIKDCAYFGDPRGGGYMWNTGNTTLVDLLDDNVSDKWIKETKTKKNIRWAGGKGISFEVWKFNNSNDNTDPCEQVACTGWNYDPTSVLGLGGLDLISGDGAGCTRSHCKTGWKDPQVASCYTCPTGTIDCGYYCTEGTSPFACAKVFEDLLPFVRTKVVDHKHESRSFKIPTTDEGLV